MFPLLHDIGFLAISSYKSWIKKLSMQGFNAHHNDSRILLRECSPKHMDTALLHCSGKLTIQLGNLASFDRFWTVSSF